MNGKNQCFLTGFISEAFKSSPGLSEIATRIRGRSLIRKQHLGLKIEEGLPES